MTKAHENEYPYVLFEEQGSTPATPGSGLAYLYRKTDNAWYFLDDGGVETPVSTGAASGYVLQSLADAKGDLIIASADNTFAKHTAPADGSQLVADSSQSDGWGSILHEYAGTAAPDADDDVDGGWAPGSFWFDTTNDKAYVCLDNTDGAAVWTEITGAGGSGDVATDAIWDAAGDLAVGSGANTAARLAIGNAGSALSRINGAVAWNSGTSFPAAAAGDRYYRTDLDYMGFVYDGTRWVSEQMFTLSIQNNAITIATLAGQLGTSGASLWLVGIRCATKVATTNNGSAYWKTEIYGSNAGGDTLLHTAVNTGTTPDTAGTWYNRAGAVGAVFDTSTYPSLFVYHEKVGSPGAYTIRGALYYRLIAT